MHLQLYGSQHIKICHIRNQYDVNTIAMLSDRVISTRWKISPSCLAFLWQVNQMDSAHPPQKIIEIISRDVAPSEYCY